MKTSVLLFLCSILPQFALGALTITLTGMPGSRDMDIAFTGGSFTSNSASSIFGTGAGTIANSNHVSLGGSFREQLLDTDFVQAYMNPAINGGFGNGQYAPLDTPVAVGADASPTSFNIVGLYLSAGGGVYRFGLVSNQPDTIEWAGGTTFTITNGANSTFSLDSGIGATFDQAFNTGSYTLDGAVVATLEINSISGTGRGGTGFGGDRSGTHRGKPFPGTGWKAK
jgi:hypothetical protein